MSSDDQALKRAELEQNRVFHINERATERELFLRDKAYSLYLFIAKILFATSASVYAFSIGAFSFLKQAPVAENALLGGWAILFISMASTYYGIIIGVKVTYLFINSIIDKKPELSDESVRLENQIKLSIHIAAGAFSVGLFMILFFFFENIHNFSNIAKAQLP